MNELVQRWFPIGNIGVGVLLSSHIGSIYIGFPLAILVFTISCREILGQNWLAVAICDIGFMSAPNNSMVLVQHISNRPAINIELIFGIMLAQYWLKTGCLLKKAG